jgi:hypothetical protein
LWQFAFLLVARVSALLAVPRRSLGAVDREPSEVSLRALLNRWISLLAAAFSFMLAALVLPWFTRYRQ